MFSVSFSGSCLYFGYFTLLTMLPIELFVQPFVICFYRCPYWSRLQHQLIFLIRKMQSALCLLNGSILIPKWYFSLFWHFSMLSNLKWTLFERGGKPARESEQIPREHWAHAYSRMLMNCQDGRGSSWCLTAAEHPWIIVSPTHPWVWDPPITWLMWNFSSAQWCEFGKWVSIFRLEFIMQCLCFNDSCGNYLVSIFISKKMVWRFFIQCI